MTKNDLTREWLTGNGVVAFIGAFMLGQTLDRPAGTYGLPYGLAIPGIPDPGTFLIVAFLFLLSFSLVLASFVPLRWIPGWGYSFVRSLSPALALIAWVAFTAGMVGHLSALPSEQWWASVLVVGAVAMFCFLAVRAFVEIIRGFARVRVGSPREPLP